MKQSDPFARSYQVNRDTVCDSDGEKDAGGRRGPAVDSLDLDPASAGLEGHDLDAVNLIAKRDRLELRQLATKREPARHHVSHWLSTPEAQIEASPRIRAPARDAGHYSVLFSPAWNLEARYRSVNRHLPQLSRFCFPAYTLSRLPASTHPPARSRPPGHGDARRCVRIRARSARRCGWCWDHRRRARRAPWPFPP
jgi:hypothetical protein